jgi:hypothetical protein
MMDSFRIQSSQMESEMRISFVYPILGAALLASAQPGLAENASVIISSPADGAQLAAMAENKVVYEVMPGPMGDHTHLYVDNKEVAVLRQLKGSHALTGLAAGAHAICIKVVNKGHTPIGVEQCIKVNVN